jgi:DNA-binding MarR family transcriptional regulator
MDCNFNEMIVVANTVPDLSPEDRAATALRALLQAGDSYRLKVAAQFGLGWTDIQAVGHLMVGELGQTDLAHRLGISTAAATALVDRLERAGVAARHAHPEDRRRSLIRLTEKGHAVIARSREWTKYAFDDLPHEQLDAFAADLHGVATNLKARADQL